MTIRVVLLFTALLAAFSGIAWGQTLEDYYKEGLGRYDRSDFRGALEKLEQGLKLAEKIDDKQAVGTFLTNIGIVYWNSGDYSKAISYHEQSLKMDRQIGDLKEEGNDLTNIGNVYRSLGDYPRALNYYEQALKIRRQIDDLKGQGIDLTNIGLVYSDLGDYSRALSNYEQALKIRSQIGDSKGEGDDLTNIGNVYLELGDYSTALSHLEQAMEIGKEIDDYKGQGIALNNIGVVYLELGDYSRALNYFEQALSVFIELGVTPEIGQTMANMGDVYLEQGRLKEALAIFSRLNWAGRLGRYYLRIGDYQAAREEFTRDIQIEVEPRNARLLVADYIGLGLALEGLRDYAGASAHYQKAAEFIERQRESLTEPQRKNFFAGKVMGFSRLEPYEGLARISLNLGDTKECFFYSEHTKSRVFLDAISKRYGGGTSNIPKGLSQQEEELTNRIASLYKQQEVAFQKGNQERFQEIEEESKQLKKEQKRLISSLRANYPEYASLRYPQPIGLDEVALHNDELLLEYEVTDKETIALLLKKGSVLKAISIPVTRDSLVELVKQYRGFTQAKTFSGLYAYDPNLGAKLYSLLIEGFVTFLSKDKKLIIIPDEILGILPFEMLVSGLPNKLEMVRGVIGPYPKGIRYLGDDYQISYYQSATSLTTIRSLRKAVAKKTLFVVADPVFDSTDTRLTGEIRVTPKGESQLSMKRGIKEDWNKSIDSAQVVFPRLERTGEIAERLRQSFGKGVKVLTGLAASENRVKREKLDQYSYLLFATHGILDNAISRIKEPALVLTQVESDGMESPATGILSGVWQFIRSILIWLGLLSGETREEEVPQEDPTPGFLTLSEVMDMKIGGEVAALTACNTGLGRNLTGEGVMGLGRAFQYAGARAVLMSLWSVEDESTNLLTEHFFRYLKEGKDKLEALWLARSDLRRAGYEHPYYWAPFILVGER